jgi:CO/xanthine dehydrogenase FAD-binding subunit
VKLGARKYLVISIVMAAALIDASDGEIRSARVAVGSASVVAQRLRALEARLVGRAVTEDFAQIIHENDLAILSPIDDLRATAAYRIDAAREIVARALREAAHARPA